jgi:hypothetical protein
MVDKAPPVCSVRLRAPGGGVGKQVVGEEPDAAEDDDILEKSGGFPRTLRLTRENPVPDPTPGIAAQGRATVAIMN